jgi:hypothetical protein
MFWLAKVKTESRDNSLACKKPPAVKITTSRTGKSVKVRYRYGMVLA